MFDISKIEGIKNKTFLVGFLDLLLLPSPGLLLIFWFYYDLFSTLETIKLIAFATAISAPFLAINTIVTLFLISRINEVMPSRKTDGDLFAGITIGIFLTCTLLYACLILNYFLDLSFSTSVSSAIIGQFLFTLLPLGSVFFRKK